MSVSDSPNPFEPWLAALNTRERAVLEKAARPDLQVAVYGVGPTRGRRIRSLRGYDNLLRWLRYMPPHSRFSLAGQPQREAGKLTVRYAVEVQHFKGGGEWTVSLAEDGRIARVVHRPDDLDPSYYVAPETIDWERDPDEP